MAFTQITNSELNERGATTLPNQPKISATALKQEFDAPAKEIVAPAVNRLIMELEAETAAASLGMEAPAGRTGTTVQEVVENIALDLSYLEGSVLDPVIAMAHGHENKELLDSYTQADEDIADAIANTHAHSNKAVIDKFGEGSDGKPTYDGQPIGGGSGSGDMSTSDYDPQETVKDAGGIVDYVTSQLPDVSGKADKVTSATEGNFASLDSNGNLADSGHKHSDYLTSHQDISGKADKVSGATNGNFAGLDSSGNLTDSGSKASDFLTSHQDISGKMDTDGSNAANHVQFPKALTVGTRASGSTVGNYSVAFGHAPKASGNNSAAFGDNGWAEGDSAFAAGYSCTAKGNYSHAEGLHCNTGENAEGSFVVGLQNGSSYPYQLVCGKNNKGNADALFIVGASNSSQNRSNGFEVYKDGTLSQDNGTTKFKFTADNGADGYYDASGTFHAFNTVAPVNADWNASSGLAQILNKPSLASVATSGSYNDLTNKPDLDGWTSEVTVSSSQAVFDNLDDTLGYKLVAEDTLVGTTAISKTTGTEPGTVKMTYTLVGATNGTTKCKLRILR